MDAAAIQAIVNGIRIRMGNISADLLHIEQALASVPAPQPPPVLPPPAPSTSISSRLTQLYRGGGEGPLMAFAVHQMYFGYEIPSLGVPSQSAVLPFYRDAFGWDGAGPDSSGGLAKRQWVNNMDATGYANAPWWPALHAAPLTWMPAV